MNLRQRHVTSAVVCALALWGCSDDSSDTTIVPDAGDAALLDAATDSGGEPGETSTSTNDTTESNTSGDSIDVVVSTDSTGDASVDATDGTEDSSIDTTENTDDDTNDDDDETSVDTTQSVDTTESSEGDADVDASASSEGDADVDASNGESTDQTSNGTSSTTNSTSSTGNGTTSVGTSSVEIDSGTTTDDVSDAAVSSDSSDVTVELDAGADSSEDSSSPIPGEEGPVWEQTRFNGVLLGTGDSVLTEDPEDTYCISTQDAGTFGFKYNVNQAESGANLGTYVPEAQMDRLMLDIAGSDYTIHLVTEDSKEYCLNVTDGTSSVVFNSFYECGQGTDEQFHYHRYPIVSVLIVPQGGTFDFCVSTLDANGAETLDADGG